MRSDASRGKPRAGAAVPAAGLAALQVAVWFAVLRAGVWFAVLRVAVWFAVLRAGVWFAVLRAGVWFAVLRAGVWFAVLCAAVWRAGLCVVRFVAPLAGVRSAVSCVAAALGAPDAVFGVPLAAPFARRPALASSARHSAASRQPPIAAESHSPKNAALH